MTRPEAPVMRVPLWFAILLGLVATPHVGPARLSTHFGTALAAAGLTDVVEVKFDEWMTPSVRPFPHDPADGRDGTVWYSGQESNVIGHLDPATGRFREFSLPTPDSGPHGLLVDPGGSVWYTANSAGLIGKLDPATGKVTEYKMPDARAGDPHSLVYTPGGVILFTVQSGNVVGRLDPKTGKIDLVPLAADAGPYGIALTSKGVAFFDEFGTNKIGRLDPATLEKTEYPLPAPRARPRRIAIGRDDAIYYTDYARGYLGHLDPSTGNVEEFQSPGGAAARPYAIAATSDGAIWYCETGDSRHNVLVRFNPDTKKMLSWPIPSGGGTVRNMVSAKGPGGPSADILWLAESGVGKLARVTIRTAATH
jgi:virginiamycin B lyase